MPEQTTPPRLPVVRYPGVNPYVRSEWRPGVTKDTNKDGDELVLMGECGIGGQRED